MSQDATRQDRALALRIAGVDNATIAKQLGYQSADAVNQDLIKALTVIHEHNSNGDGLRAAEVLRLDRLQAAAWTRATNGDVRAIDVVLRIITYRAQLLGLAAPQRHEVTRLESVDAEIKRLANELGTAT